MKYLKPQNNDYIVDAEKICVYIPSYYFASGMANELGNQIDTIGIITLEVWDKTLKTPEIWEMNCPVVIHVMSSENSKVTRTFSKIDPTPEEYRVFTAYKGEVILSNAIHVQNTKAANRFLSFILNGKIPNNLKYSDLPYNLLKSASFNGVKTGVPNSLVELLMGELARDSKDLTIPFRKVAGKTGAETGYQTIKINELPALASTFGGLAFENINDAILSGLVNSKQGREEITAPTEEVLYF